MGTISGTKLPIHSIGIDISLFKLLTWHLTRKRLNKVKNKKNVLIGIKLMKWNVIQW